LRLASTSEAIGPVGCASQSVSEQKRPNQRIRRRWGSAGTTETVGALPKPRLELTGIPPSAIVHVYRRRRKPVQAGQPLFEALGQCTFVIANEPPKANLVKLSGNFLIAAQYLDILTNTLFAPAHRALFGHKKYEIQHDINS
jgi:hypothetical protein